MVYRLNRCREAISDLIDKGILKCKENSSSSSVVDLYPRSHSSKRNSSELIESFDDLDRASMMSKLAEEYAIFRRLNELSIN